MMNIRFTILSAMAFFALGEAQAQKAWSLRQCIDYALEHNITVKQMQNIREQQALQLNTNKNSRLPDLNASVGENISFGRGLTAQNTYEDRTTSSTSFSLGTTVSLFDGNKTTHNIRLSKLNLDAADADLSKARNDLSMNVAKAYIEALNNMEIADVARRQVSIDSMQVARLQTIVENGKASVAELSQQKAALWRRASLRLPQPATTASSPYSTCRSCSNSPRPMASLSCALSPRISIPSLMCLHLPLSSLPMPL